MAFRKRGLDVYDFTLLQRKGLVEKPKEQEAPAANLDSQGYFDFAAAQNTQAPAMQDLTTSPPSEASNPLSFFDTFAQSSQAPHLDGGLPEPPKHEPTEITDIKVKLEDFEYKLEKLTDKLILIESRLDEFGNKGL